MKQLAKFAFWILIAVSAFLLWKVIHNARGEQRIAEISYSTFIAEAQSGQIVRVTVTGREIRGVYQDGAAFHLTGPDNPVVYLPTLQDKGVEIVFQDAPRHSMFLQLVATWAPALLLGTLWLFLIRQLRRRNRPRPPEPDVPQGMIDPRTGEIR